MGGRILTLYYRPKPGGLFKRHCEIIQAFLDRGWEVHYLSTEPFPVVHKRLVYHKVRLPVSFGFPLFWPIFLLTAPFFICRLSREIRPHLVFAPSLTYAGLACMVDAPVATFIGGDELEDAKEKFGGIFRVMGTLVLGFLGRVGCRKSSVLVSNSLSLCERITRQYNPDPLRVRVVRNEIRAQKDSPNETPIREEFSLTKGTFIILSTNRPHPRKNYPFMLKALAEAIKRVEPLSLTLFIVGDDADTGGGEIKKLKNLVRELGIEEHVIFTGWRDDVPSLLKAADLYVTPSKHEGCPNALLEAIGAGLPCLGTDIPEIREVLSSPELLFPLGDGGKVLSKKLARLYSDLLYKKRLRLLSQNRRSFYTFGWEEKMREVLVKPLLFSG